MSRSKGQKIDDTSRKARIETLQNALSLLDNGDVETAKGMADFMLEAYASDLSPGVMLSLSAAVTQRDIKEVRRHLKDAISEM